jgi:hypothetical protein
VSLSLDGTISPPSCRANSKEMRFSGQKVSTARGRLTPLTEATIHGPVSCAALTTPTSRSPLSGPESGPWSPNGSVRLRPEDVTWTEGPGARRSPDPDRFLPLRFSQLRRLLPFFGSPPSHVPCFRSTNTQAPLWGVPLDLQLLAGSPLETLDLRRASATREIRLRVLCPGYADPRQRPPPAVTRTLLVPPARQPWGA